VELDAIRQVFGDNVPPVSSTKSLTGHSQGATAVHEVIYSLLMMNNQFVCASANIEELDPEAEGLPIATERLDNVKLDTVLSNSFGFGGTNCSLTFSRVSL
jgi:3-oxoacyl-[acyl-carrier-protein] synthase-1